MLRFPAQPDIRLQRAPLTEVICQVRFPPVLRIAHETPVAFQEAIRGSFPQLEVEQGRAVRFAPLGGAPPAPGAQARIFRFKSADGQTSVSLALDFFTLSTTAYTHWADFLALFELATRAAREVYQLPYAVRLGLRYVNRLTFANTGTADVSELWDIVRPELTVLLRQGSWSKPEEMFNQLLLAGEADEHFALRNGFGGEGEPFFLLDFDHYVEGQISFEALPALCQRFHDTIYHAFRWSIREDRLAVFGPLPDEEQPL